MRTFYILSGEQQVEKSPVKQETVEINHISEGIQGFFLNCKYC